MQRARRNLTHCHVEARYAPLCSPTTQRTSHAEKQRVQLASRFLTPQSVPGPGRGGTANDACVLSHKIETVDLKSAPSKMAGRFYLLLHCMHPASLGAPGGFIPISALLAHRVTAASDDGSLRSVGGRGGSTRPPMHASADSPGLRWHQNVPVAAGHRWRL